MLSQVINIIIEYEKLIVEDNYKFRIYISRNFEEIQKIKQ